MKPPAKPGLELPDGNYPNFGILVRNLPSAAACQLPLQAADTMLKIFAHFRRTPVIRPGGQAS